MNQQLREEINQLHAEVCSGLADPNRVFILYTLSEKEHTVNDLAEAVGLPQPTTSRHLKILRERGMVSARRTGQSVEYSLADRRIIQALDILRAFLIDRIDAQANLARSFAEAI